MSENRDRRPVSVIGPLILIVIGLVFLLNNLNIISGNIWDTVIRLWPVIFIAFGLDGILRREGLVGPIFLIGLGTVFLLSNFGMLNLNVWTTILRLWPVLLIAIGLDIAIGRRSTVGAIIGLLILLVVLFGSLWLYGVRFEPGQALSSETISQPLEDINQARIVIDPSAGDLHIESIPEPGMLVEGTVRMRNSENVRQDYSVTGNQAVYSLKTSGVIVYLPGDANSTGWDLNLTEEIPLDLEVDLGVGQLVLDLQGLELSDLEVNFGVGAARLTLPESGDFQGNVGGGIGQTTIILPRGLPVRFNTDTGLTSVQAPSDFERQNDIYTSPAYASSDQRIDIGVDLGIGNLVIRYAGE